MKMNQISCNIIEDLMPIYTEGLCSEDSRILIEKHLETCESCRQLSEQIPVPETISEQELEPQKAFLKINRTLKYRKIFSILLCAILGVILIGLGYLTIGQIKKSPDMQSFETIWQSIEVHHLTKCIVNEDFDTYMKYVSYDDYVDFGLESEALEALQMHEKEQLQASYRAAFGGAKADHIQVETYYSGIIYSMVTVTFDDGQIMKLQFSKNSRNLYNCFAVLNNSPERSLFQRHIGYLNNHNFVYYPIGWVQSLLTRDQPLDEKAKSSVSGRFAAIYQESVADHIAAFYQKGYSVSNCTLSDLQFNREKQLLFYEIFITAEDAYGTAILHTRIYNDMDGWIPPEPEDYTIYMDGCTDQLADDLRTFFG